MEVDLHFFVFLRPFPGPGALLSAPPAVVPRDFLKLFHEEMSPLTLFGEVAISSLSRFENHLAIRELAHFSSAPVPAENCLAERQGGAPARGIGSAESLCEGRKYPRQVR